MLLQFPSYSHEVWKTSLNWEVFFPTSSPSEQCTLPLLSQAQHPSPTTALHSLDWPARKHCNRKVRQQLAEEKTARLADPKPTKGVMAMLEKELAQDL